MVFIWLPVIFVLGAVIGSFLNVCVSRLPWEKSILWPLTSHCGHCFQPICWYDNIPLLSYWLRHGRCRTCGQKFSVRYFLVELLTGLGFTGLFYLEVVENIHGWSVLRAQQFEIALGVIPAEGWILFGFHALLFCFLIVAAFCDLDHREIPLSITVPGTLVGLTGAVLFPWPWPLPATAGLPPRNLANQPWWLLPPEDAPRHGLYPWPVWGPLPDELPPGSWQLGLVTGLAGLLAGTFLLRGVRYLFSKGLGVEALGLGDADLMMMAGAFLGWQPLVVAFFVGVFPALFFGLAGVILRGDNTLPFGPSLAIGIVCTWLFWDRIAPSVQPLFFAAWLLLPLVVFGAAFMLGASYFLGILRPREAPAEEKQ